MFSAYHSHRSFCIDVALVLPPKSGDSDMNHFLLGLTHILMNSKIYYPDITVIIVCWPFKHGRIYQTVTTNSVLINERELGKGRSNSPELLNKKPYLANACFQ